MQTAERLLILIERLIQEQAATNEFLAQIVAHNADLIESSDDTEDEPTTYLSGEPIQ